MFGMIYLKIDLYFLMIPWGAPLCITYDHLAKLFGKYPYRFFDYLYKGIWHNFKWSKDLYGYFWSLLNILYYSLIRFVVNKCLLILLIALPFCSLFPFLCRKSWAWYSTMCLFIFCYLFFWCHNLKFIVNTLYLLIITLLWGSQIWPLWVATCELLSLKSRLLSTFHNGLPKHAQQLGVGRGKAVER